MSELCPTANLPLLAGRWPLAVTLALSLIKLARCLEALDSLLPLSCSSRFRGMATASVPHCRKSQLHAKGVRLATHWHSTNPRAKCHTPQTECAQEGLSDSLQWREAIAWPGAMCVQTDSRVVVAVPNNHFHGNPNYLRKK